MFMKNFSARLSYLKLEYSTSINSQNSNLAKLELEKTLKNLYYSSQTSKYSMKLDKTRTR